MALCGNCFREIDNNATCSFCGYNASADLEAYALALRSGSILAGRYIVGRVLGQGGFGITYSALDYKRKKLVAIKEHFPASLVTRSDLREVRLVSRNLDVDFSEGKEKFLEEAKTLSQFNGLNNICEIYSYFEENGTAYFAMEYVEGIPLDEYMKKQNRVLSFEEALRLLLPVMQALSRIHSAGIIHRDLSPDNIMITPYNGVKLIDFGAARYSMGEKSRSLDVILKHGFAPKEQYARRSRQGAYTDVYALAATFYYAITGRVPPDAIERSDNDELVAPSKFGVKIPHKAEQALLKALAVDYKNRFQTMDEFIHKLRPFLPDTKADAAFNPTATSKARSASGKAKDEVNTASLIPEQSKKSSKTPLVLAAVLAVLAIGIGAFFAFGKGDSADVPNAAVTENIVSESPAEMTWELIEDGTLTISGKGDMPEYINGAHPWASNRGEIKKLIIEKGITGIDSFAFDNCQALTSVSLPEGILSIGDGAFSNCSALNSINIPGSTISIGKHAFTNCSSMDSIVIEEGVASIGEAAFSACGLSSVTIPDTVTSIGDDAFSKCSSLSTIEIPDSVTYLGARAFKNCESLSSVILSKNITDINEACFAGCKALSNIELPYGIKSIGKDAFGVCWSLNSIRIPDSVSSVGASAFNDCRSLNSVSIGSGVESIGVSAFEACPALNTIDYSGTEKQWSSVVIGEYNEALGKARINFTLAAGTSGNNINWVLSNSGCLTISGSGAMVEFDRNQLASGAIISAAPWAENGLNERIIDVIIMPGVTSISNHAFAGCYSLRSISVPDGISRVGDRAFLDCRALSSIDLPEGVTSIGRVAFVNCYSLSSISLPNSLTSIGIGAFEDCAALSSIVLPEKLKNLGYAAFYYCTSLRSVVIPEGVDCIDQETFIGCSSLHNVSIPSSVTSIMDNAFSGCSSLQSIEFAGSSDQWKSIKIGSGNEYLYNSKINCTG